jgi:retron-type reverse transcriptase
VHLDGYDQTELVTKLGPSARKDFYYFTETVLHGVRYGDYKFLFKTQDKWFNGVQQSLVTPIIVNLKLDPFERFIDARGHDEWQENRSWMLPAASELVVNLVKSLKDYPPRQKSTDFNIDEMMRALNEPATP